MESSGRKNITDIDSRCTDILFYRVNNDQNRTNYGYDETCVVYNIAYRISPLPAVMAPAPAVPASEEQCKEIAKWAEQRDIEV